MIIDLKRERAKRRAEEPLPYGTKAERMTDAEFEQQCDRIRSCVESLVPTMRLEHYDLTLSFEPDRISDNAVMSICSDWRYKWASIEASIKLCAESSDEEMTYHVLHEGAHAHLAMLRLDNESDEWRDREEYVATEFGQIALNCLKRGYEQGCDESAETLAEKDALIMDLKRQVKQRERQIARLEKGKAA